MFDVVVKETNRLDIDLSGKLDSEGMKAALDALVSQSAGMENGRMLYRLNDFDWPTLGAIGVELSRLPELFRTIKRFDRVAVLCDKKWVQRLSEIEGALIPGLTIRSFNHDALEAAEQWLVE